MRRDIMLLDGACGTNLWAKTEDKVAVWRYNVEQPEIVRELLQEYIDAGSDYVFANTFGANRTSMKKVRASKTNKAQGIKKPQYTVPQIVSEAMKIVHEVADGKARIILDVGPLTGLMEPYGDISEEDCREIYREQIGTGVSYGVDAIFLETFLDLDMLKIAAGVAREYDVPLFCSMSFEENGRTLMGNLPKDVVEGLAPYHVDAIGINCSLGPDMALPIVKQYAEATDIPLIFKPNAGKPVLDENGHETTEVGVDAFVEDVMQALEYNVKYIGGCCGSNPDYIKALRQRIDERLAQGE